MGTKVTVLSQKVHAEQKFEKLAAPHIFSRFPQIQALVRLVMFFSGRISAFCFKRMSRPATVT